MTLCDALQAVADDRDTATETGTGTLTSRATGTLTCRSCWEVQQWMTMTEH
jgi:hypothetical protein